MKQITLRTHVRTVLGKGTLWEHKFAFLVETGKTLGLESLTVVPQADFAPLYEVVFESDAGDITHEYFLDYKKAEKCLLNGGA